VAAPRPLQWLSLEAVSLVLSLEALALALVQVLGLGLV
jgi:hypothetical protein